MAARHEGGMAGEGERERGRLARNAALGRGGALTLAFSHEGLTGVGLR